MENNKFGFTIPLASVLIALCMVIPALPVIFNQTGELPEITNDNIAMENNVYPGPVTLGSEEIIFDWSTDAFEMGDLPDAPARAFIDSNGDVQLLATHDTNRRMMGSDLNNLVQMPGVVMASDLDPNPANYNSNEWLQSLYVTPDDTIHALIHNEYVGNAYGQYSGYWTESWYNSITYAKSTDNGATYTHPAAPNHLVASIPYTYQQMEGHGPAGIFGGSNIIKNPNDGYYYNLVHLEVFGYQDWGVGVMRTDNISDPSSWMAWDGTGFCAEPINPYTQGIFDPAEHIFQPVSRDNITKMTGSVTFNTYFNKFLLVGMQCDGDGRRPDGIYYSLSDDLINWTPDQLILECETWWQTDLMDDKHHYPSIIDPDSPGRNFEYSDQDAYLYYTLWHDDDPSTTLNRDLVRVPITFSCISNYAPTRPYCMYPEYYEGNVDLTPTLEASDFSDPDNDAHLASQWQIRNFTGDYSSPAYDSGWTTTSLEIIHVPVSLDYSTYYYWRVRYMDAENASSPWSLELPFSTMAPNSPPVKPLGNSPPDGTIGVGVNGLSLQSSPYIDPNGNSHKATQWQITTIPGDYTNPVFDSGSDMVNKEFIFLPLLLELNTTHYWRLRYQDQYNAWSDWSDEICFTTEIATPPSAPTGFSAMALGSSEIMLDWDDNLEPDMEYYRIYRCVNTGFECNSSNLVANVSIFASSNHIDGGLTGNTEYFYRVTAVDDCGAESVPSTEDSATTTIDTVPGAPTNLAVSWDATSDILFLDEEFSDMMVPPTGWAENDPTGSWNLGWSNAAGVDAPEAKFTQPGYSIDEIWRLYAGPLDTTNMGSLNLAWNTYYEDWGGEPNKVTIKIQTSSDGIVWQDTTWSHTSGNGNYGPGREELTLSTTDIGSSTFYVGFTIDGDAFDMNYWYLDNIYLNYSAPAPQYNNLLTWNLSPDDGTGDNDVDYYNIYRSDVQSGPWDEVHIIDMVPAGTDSYYDIDMGEFDGTNWYYVVRAVDRTSNTDENCNVISESGVITKPYDIDLSGFSAGNWAFISFPYDITGDIETVFDDSVSGGGGTTWDIAKWYDSINGTWKTYSTLGAGIDNMPTISNAMGIWLHLTASDGVLSTGIAGDYPSVATEIALYTGWNLVGYPSATPRTADIALSSAGADLIGVYQAGAPYITDITNLASVTMSEGNAYWVHVNADTIWTINP